MKVLAGVCLALLVVGPAGAITGDLNKDGKVDFQDFFILAENFGKQGPVDPPDTVIVVQVDTLTVVRVDTVIVVQLDTVFLGLPEIPIAPPIDQVTGVEIVEESLFVGGFFTTDVSGLIVNNTTKTYENVSVRLIIRDADGKILAVEDHHFEPTIYVLAPGDKRVFRFFNVSNIASLSDLEFATFTVSWSRETDQELSNDLLLITDTLNLSGGISGEVQNIGPSQVEDILITFVGLNSIGQVISQDTRRVNFGGDLQPGATGVFETFLFDTTADEIYYYITWCRWRDESETPLIKLEVE